MAGMSSARDVAVDQARGGGVGVGDAERGQDLGLQALHRLGLRRRSRGRSPADAAGRARRDAGDGACGSMPRSAASARDRLGRQHDVAQVGAVLAQPRPAASGRGRTARWWARPCRDRCGSAGAPAHRCRARRWPRCRARSAAARWRASAAAACADRLLEAAEAAPVAVLVDDRRRSAVREAPARPRTRPAAACRRRTVARQRSWRMSAYAGLVVGFDDAGHQVAAHHVAGREADRLDARDAGEQRPPPPPGPSAGPAAGRSGSDRR